MKDPNVVSFSPMFHFTDHKIRVHAFYCVLALIVARLMVRQADRPGLHMSVRRLLATLAGIQETVFIYQGQRGRPRARCMLTEMEPTKAASTTCSPSAPMPQEAMNTHHVPALGVGPLRPPCATAARSFSPTTTCPAPSAPTPSDGSVTGPCSSPTRPAAKPPPAPSPPTPANGGAAYTSTRSIA